MEENNVDFIQPTPINTDPFINSQINGGPSESERMSQLAQSQPTTEVEAIPLSKQLLEISTMTPVAPLNLGGTIGVGTGGGGSNPFDIGSSMDHRMQSDKFDIDQDEVYTELSTKAWEDWSGFGKVRKYEEFIKGEDNEDRLARKQSGWEVLGRGVEKSLVTASSMVLNTVGMVAYGLPKAVQNKSLMAMIDNDFSRFVDDLNTTYAHEDMIYKSKEYRNASALGQVAYGEWWADTFLQGIGFLVGGLAVGGATGLALKGVGLAGGTIGGASRGALMNLAKAGVKGELKTLAKEGIIKTFKQAIKKDLMNTTLKSTASNTISLLTSAAPESQMEALSFMKEDENSFLDHFQKANGRVPTETEMTAYRKEARKVGNGVFAANLALVGSSNLLQFGDLLGADKLFKKGIIDGIINKTFGLNLTKTAVEVGKEGLESATWSLGKRSIAQMAGFRAFKALESPVTEGLWEEGMQSVVQNTASDYMESRFNLEASKKNKGIMESFYNGLSETYGTKEGWQEILAGMMVGAAGTLRVGRGGFNFLNQREVSTAGIEATANDLNTTQEGLVNATSKLLESQNTYNNLRNQATLNLQQRVGSTNQQIANSDKARLASARGDLEAAQEYYTNAVFAKLMAEERAGLTEENRFDIDMMIDNVPNETLRDMYGFTSQEDMDSFKDSLKLNMENQREAFKVANEFANTLNLQSTNTMNYANLQEATALQFFHGLMAADTANTLATSISSLVGDQGIASAMNYYSNMSAENQARVSEIQDKKQRISELEAKRNVILSNFSILSNKVAREPENEAFVKELDLANVEMEELNNSIQATQEEVDKVSAILNESANIPKLPFGNPANKYFSGIGLDVTNTDIESVMSSLGQIDTYMKHLLSREGKSESQIEEDKVKADTLAKLTNMYQSQMKRTRNFAKIANMVSDPSYGNNLYKKIRKKKDTKFDNKEWTKNDSHGFDLENERNLNRKFSELDPEFQKLVDEGVISEYDAHTWKTNIEIMSMNGTVLGDSLITTSELNSVINIDENGEVSFDEESDAGAEMVDGIVRDIVRGVGLSKSQSLIYSLNKDAISERVAEEMNLSAPTIQSKVKTNNNSEVSVRERLKKIADKKAQDAIEAYNKRLDEMFNNGTFDLSKLRDESSKQYNGEKVVLGQDLEVGDTIKHLGEAKVIKEIVFDLFGVKGIKFEDGSSLTVVDPDGAKFIKVLPKLSNTSTDNTVVNEGITEDMSIDDIAAIFERELEEELDRIEAEYQEALNPTQQETETIAQAIKDIDEVIQSVVDMLESNGLDINREYTENFNDDYIPTKEDFKRINEILAKDDLSQSDIEDLDRLNNKINSYGLVEGRVGDLSGTPIRLSDLLEQRNQLEKELFNIRKEVTPLNLEELKMTFDPTTDENESTPTFKNGSKAGDAAVTNSYAFSTFMKLSDGRFQVANITPQGFIEEVLLEKQGHLEVYDTDQNEKTIDLNDPNWDSQFEIGDEVSIHFQTESGEEVSVGFEVDSSRRLVMPQESLDILNEHTPLNFDPKNVIGHSQYYVVTKSVGNTDVYLGSDFDLETDTEATQQLKQGDAIRFEFDNEAPFNVALMEEYRSNTPDTNNFVYEIRDNVLDLLDEIEDNLEKKKDPLENKAELSRQNKILYEEVKLLLPNLKTYTPASIKKGVKELVKNYEDSFDQVKIDELQRKIKDNMVVVATDSSGNRVGVMKSLSNSSVKGEGRRRMDFLRTSLFNDVLNNNFKKGTKTKFSTPVQIMYMGIPNIISENGSKKVYRFSDQVGDANIPLNKVESVGYVTYGGMKFSNGIEYDTPYNYAKSILSNEAYKDRRVPVIVFNHTGKEVIYPIGLLEKDTQTLEEKFQEILDKEGNISFSEFASEVNTFLAENGISKDLRLTSLNYSTMMDQLKNTVANTPNISSIEELMDPSLSMITLENYAYVDINLMDNPFVGPKLRLNLETVPEVSSPLLNEVSVVGATQQTMEEIAEEEEENNICLD